MTPAALKCGLQKCVWLIVFCALSASVEPFSVDIPLNAGSSNSRKILPENIVQAQLDLFKASDIETAYELYISQESKEVTSGSWQEFAEEILEQPFSAIVGHDEATVLMTVSGNYAQPESAHIDDDGDSEEIHDVFYQRKLDCTNCMCLVRIIPCSEEQKDGLSTRIRTTNGKSCETPLQYWWELSKYASTDDAGKAGGGEPVWFVDSIVPDFESMELEDIALDDDSWLGVFEDSDDDEDDEMLW